MHATIPKGNLGYDQYTFLDTVAVEPTFVAFTLHSQTNVLACRAIFTDFPETLKLSKNEVKATHNIFRSDNLSRNSCV